MEQKHEFELLSRNRLESLNDLLVDTATELGVDFNGCGARSGTRRVNNQPAPPIDFGDYNIIYQNQKVGQYWWRFQHQKDRYNVLLDLSELPSDIYEVISRALSPRFPEIQFPAYTG